MKVWCFDDANGWGQGLYLAAREAKHDPIMFDDPNIPDEGMAFYHMHHHPMVRKLHKRAMQKLSLQRDLLLIPGLRSAELFDDKVEQARHFAKWMPRTRLFFSPSVARTYIEVDNPFPFYSKAAEGTSGYNVRKVESYEAAKLEIKFAFSDRGLKARYGQKQIGYLMWQEAVPNDGYTFRVFGIGRKRLVLKRYEDDRKAEPVNHVNDEVAAVLAFADRFFEREGMVWGAVDIIRDNVTGRFYVLETTVGWAMESIAHCRFIDCETVTGQGTADIWKVLMVELANGRLGDFVSHAA